jgi:hypothetical protein
MGLLQVQTFDGRGNLGFEDRPYVIMTDEAFVDLGTYRSRPLRGPEMGHLAPGILLATISERARNVAPQRTQRPMLLASAGPRGLRVCRPR